MIFYSAREAEGRAWAPGQLTDTAVKAAGGKE